MTTELITKPTEVAHLPTDLQARLMCAAENLQRQDLSDIESIDAIVEMVDAELVDVEGYEDLGTSPVDRVRTLLVKLDSDYKNETDHLRHKFMSNIEAIFSSLPRPLEWRSFFNNDLPRLLPLSRSVLAKTGAAKKASSRVE